MSKRLILILVAVFVLGLAFSAYAEVQNVKVSGDITMTAIGRNDLTLTTNEPTTSDFGKKIRTFLSQVRVRVDADLTDNVSTTVRLLNERTWGEELDEPNAPDTYKDSENSSIDIDLAYATLKEFLYSPLTLTVGRQEMKFGNGLVLGARTTNAIAGGHGNANRFLPNSIDDFSLRKSFDAIRATLDYNPLAIDLLYSRLSESSVKTFDNANLYGINANYAFNKNLDTELYTFLRQRDTGFMTAGVAGQPSKGENLYATGLRANYTGIKDLALGLEGAIQYGNHIANTDIYPNEGADTNQSRSVKAWAIQAIADYKLPVMVKYTPTVGGSYTYLSGDKPGSTNNTYKGWDPMFEDQNGGTLFNKIFALTNMQIYNINASVKPMDDIKLMANYYYLRANQPYATGDTGTVTLSGIPGDPTYTMKGGKLDLGNEIDLGVTYDYTEDVQFALTGGAFIPGQAFDKQEGNRKTAKQLVGSMKVTF
ncbi:MAG: alginate export family protein [Candidatus Omnitrophica bacterium]|nr:alginate export family protein [Candidatus Omnitrophota bacterium]